VTKRDEVGEGPLKLRGIIILWTTAKSFCQRQKLRTKSRITYIINKVASQFINQSSIMNVYTIQYNGKFALKN